MQDSNDINMELSPFNTPGGAAERSAPGAAGTYEDPVIYQVLEPQVPQVQVIPAECGPQDDVDLMTFHDEVSQPQMSLAEEEAALAEDVQGDEAAVKDSVHV